MRIAPWDSVIGPGLLDTPAAKSMGSAFNKCRPHMLHVWSIYLQNWVIFRAHVGEYSMHGAYGDYFRWSQKLRRKYVFFSHVWIGHRSTCIMKWLLVRSSRNKCGTIEDAQGSCMPEDLVVKSALGHGRLMKGTHDKIGQQTRPKVEWTV